ncbi:MAG: alpha-glucan family phosphorylase, partial [Deltaproteobacteria bacterium]|nr:alpha-glucan family phosphorylase [Deltaproteobacteria bacterium]
MNHEDIYSEIKSLAPQIAYFSMEIGLRVDLPTYSGGLGVLAGDTIKAAADHKLPYVAVTLLYRDGYFQQHLDENGQQSEKPVKWKPTDLLIELKQITVTVEIGNRRVALRPWLYVVEGCDGGQVPVFFLDSDLPENGPEERQLTAQLYGGDKRYRLCQEIILGIGGLRLLSALEIRNIINFHLNEGHAALLTLELLQRYRRNIEETWDPNQVWDYERVRRHCVFTTHTPVPAGHDRFDYALVEELLGAYIPLAVLKRFAGPNDLNLTTLALNLSRHTNAVSKCHRDVSALMFPDHEIKAVTNGVHSASWTNHEFQELFDRYLPGWRRDNFLLRNAMMIPDDELFAAHQSAKQRLFQYILNKTAVELDPEILTIGFARRATPYKRATLLFSNPERLRHITKYYGPLQLVLAGKAHPHDEPGKQLIRDIFGAQEQLSDLIKIVYLENYDMELGKLITGGVDLWLNTPTRPLEASGTSGMKAAHNGVPNFSILDGWWIEGWIEGKTGWAIGPLPTGPQVDEESNRLDADDLYDKLEKSIIPIYYNERPVWIEIMRQAISFNASFFNTYRMLMEYCMNIYSFDPPNRA